MRPIFGLASMIHDTVNRIPGITSGMMASAKNSVLNGVLVRSFIQARPVPTQSESTAAPTANSRELTKQTRVVAVQIGGAEILQRELRRRGRGLRREKALPQQEHERHQREPDDQRHRHTDQHPFRIEPRRGSGQRQRARPRRSPRRSRAPAQMRSCPRHREQTEQAARPMSRSGVNHACESDHDRHGDDGGHDRDDARDHGHDGGGA